MTLATVNGFAITDTCSVNTQGTITNDLHVASSAPAARALGAGEPCRTEGSVIPAG